MSESEPQAVEQRAHVHHGRTVAAWTGSIIAGVGFILGAIAFLLGPNWTLVWVAVALLITAVVAGDVLRRTGRGQIP